MTYIPEEIKKVLEENGWDYELVHKKKHAVLRVEGKNTIPISHGKTVKRRTLLNGIARLRRIMKERDNE